jgi:hypothetical protein
VVDGLSPESVQLVALTFVQTVAVVGAVRSRVYPVGAGPVDGAVQFTVALDEVLLGAAAVGG